jgi:branched-chain amino acid transport system substrate-binding protein
MQQLFPGVKTATSQMPKLFAGQFGAEISALLTSGADVVHTSFWGGDLEAFILQAAPRGLLKKSTAVLTTGETAMFKLAAQIPDGTVIGARGPFGPFAPDTALNKWFSSTFKDRYNVPPNYAAYQMAQAIMGVKLAWEKAQDAKGGQKPTNEEVAAALENMTWEGPGGIVRMSLGKGHQAVMETAYGQTKMVKGQMTIANVRRFPAEKLNPPDGMKSADWIANGFRAK